MRLRGHFGVGCLLICALLVAVAGCDCRSAAGQIIDPGSAEEVFTQCGAVDIVFMMDTSGSMTDEAEALCTQLDGVFTEIAELGLTDVRIFKWGITQDAQSDPDFPCLTDNVKNIFDDPVVPGTTDRRLNLGDSDEDWGPGTAIVAELGSGGRNQNFQWREGAIRILVPISDEGPSNGDPADNPDDAELIANAISFANANDVIVSPIIGTGAEPATSEHARDLANGTGGIAVRSVDPGLDLGQLIFDIVLVACGGTPERPAPPPDPGPTILVAAGRQDGAVYRIDPTNAQAIRLVDTAVDGVPTDTLDYIASMVFNERTGDLWASMGGNASCEACTFRIAPSGTATLLADNDDEAEYGIPGMAQRRSDRFIFAMEGDNDDLLALNNQTGDAAEFADDFDFIDESGNSLTFVGENLYLASGMELWQLDTFTGHPTLVGAITLSGVPSPAEIEFRILAMTTRPSDNKVFCILRDHESSPRRYHLCQLNVSTAVATFIGEFEIELNGLAWVPAGYFVSPT